ncbi:MAG: biotin--[acetyl-CoA-carboxylase] ligase [Thermoplasmata archaeon]
MYMNVLHLEELASTNSYAMKLANEGVEECTVVRADVQTHGRGRRDRIWHSDEGGLWFSIILYPEIAANEGFSLTMLSSVAVAQALGSLGVNPGIKWPNDILIDGKKVCGILSEFEASDGKITTAVLGVGLNVNNELPGELEKATSLKKHLGRKVDMEALFNDILKIFNEYYVGGMTDRDILIRWILYSVVLWRWMKVSVRGEEKVCFVKGIDRTGRLVINVNGEIETIAADEIEYIEERGSR